MNGITTVPRWTLDPAAGAGTCEVRAADTLTSALHRLAVEMGVPLSSVLLAANLKVLGALSGEAEVASGYAVSGGAPVPLRMTLSDGSWRGLIQEAARVESEARARFDVPIRPLSGGPDSAEAPYETVFEMATLAGFLERGVVLRIAFADVGRLLLTLRYWKEALDAEFAARCAGYHLTALTLIAAGPDREHRHASLLGADELSRQVFAMGGPARELPDLRPHEVFQARARAHPDATAATLGDRKLSYGELNSRANRLARALLERGLSREGVVGVVTDRDLDWLTAVLAILKAGGVYLPLDPQFPPERIARTLARSGCRMVLTQRGRTGSLDTARESLPGVDVFFIDAALREGNPAADPAVSVCADQLAYIFFTSGSTGEPKGAMCEHAGFLNHLFAKIDDLGIREGDVVAQTASQCFDISMWQLLSALMVGGQTLIVEQETILDAPRFIERIVEARVNVLQVVPSYLDVLTAYLAAHPRELPDVRYVVATGEALKKELVERWFAVQPGIRLVNAYGLTETSDDTNHEIMDRAPRQARVPLGRPIANVAIYVLDEQGAPVPLGAPGEIVFSGVCVGRGYINDPERTRRSFGSDPYHAGQRMYKSGDYGRWLPDGKLEFLGRRDTQVKVNGFRIEIGEIENRLLRVPLVGDAAVVVTERPGRGALLVAFYSGPQRQDPAAIAAALRESLPAYMVPASFHWRERLPLTANGKIDRKALAVLAGGLEVSAVNRDGPATPTEQRVAAAWAKVLGIPESQIGRQDGFFDLGGTSLSTLALAIALDRAVTVKDVFAHPRLAEQAGLIDDRVPGDGAGAATEVA